MTLLEMAVGLSGTVDALVVDEAWALEADVEADVEVEVGFMSGNDPSSPDKFQLLMTPYIKLYKHNTYNMC